MCRSTLLFAAIAVLMSGEAWAQFAGGAQLAGGKSVVVGFGNAGTMGVSNTGAGNAGMGANAAAGVVNVGFGNASAMGAGTGQPFAGGSFSNPALVGFSNPALMVGRGRGVNANVTGMSLYPGGPFGNPYIAPNQNRTFGGNTSLAIANTPQKIGLQGPFGVQYYYNQGYGNQRYGGAAKAGYPGQPSAAASGAQVYGSGYSSPLRYGSPGSHGSASYGRASMFNGGRTLMTGTYGGRGAY